MKLTARIKKKTSPMAKLIRRITSEKPTVIIDPMGDAALVRRIMTAARKAGRSLDSVVL